MVAGWSGDQWPVISSVGLCFPSYIKLIIWSNERLVTTRWSSVDQCTSGPGLPSYRLVSVPCVPTLTLISLQWQWKQYGHWTHVVTKSEFSCTAAPSIMCYYSPCWQYFHFVPATDQEQTPGGDHLVSTDQDQLWWQVMEPHWGEARLPEIQWGSDWCLQCHHECWDHHYPGNILSSDKWLVYAININWRTWPWPAISNNVVEKYLKLYIDNIHNYKLIIKFDIVTNKKLQSYSKVPIP